MRHHTLRRPFNRLSLLAGASAVLLAACENQPLDYDLRGINGGFSTAEAATGPVADRPAPDSRGVITYPNYQAVIAQQNDTLATVAARVGMDTNELAQYNGIDPNARLRKDEVIVLPRRAGAVAPNSAPVSNQTASNRPVDITNLAGNAINRSPATPGVQTAALPPATTATPTTSRGKEPVRHKVEPGETAYTISRLYNVPVKSLAEWNGLGPDFSIRAGQILLIPVPQQNPPVSARVVPVAPTTTPPGVGSPTPTPPSSSKPLPQDTTAKPLPAQVATPAKPVADVGKTTAASSNSRMSPPLQGSIIRGYTKGKNEGINIKAAPGTAVKAADAGTVAAITKSAEGVPIVVVRHPDNLLTVYANVADVNVAKGDSVARGQQIAKLRGGDDAFVHFEVRKGFDSVDPTPYIQ